MSAKNTNSVLDKVLPSEFSSSVKKSVRYFLHAKRTDTMVIKSNPWLSKQESHISFLEIDAIMLGKINTFVTGTNAIKNKQI
jgi:hypothetical protein